MDSNVYRPLTDAELDILKGNGCRSDNWASVEVIEGFDARAVSNCRFAERVRIGRGVRLSDVGMLANYTIADNVVIERVGELIISDDTLGATMGNGVQVATINENGGRSVAIFDKLTAQIAYIEAMYRHRPTAVEKLRQWAQIAPRKWGFIGEANVIRDCGSLRDITTAYGTKIAGATIIDNATILENASVGAGAKIYSSVIASNAVVDNGTLLERCFIGEGSIVSNFTAADSLVFSNCELLNGEAVSIFAAPYTVSHHKSSLLIAGMFSFFNAGSGSNQSNHLFKTGAVHQGVHRRGVKFASNAYVMLPAVEGAFTTIIGNHKKHHNTEDLPYSYLIEEGGDSWLRPAAILTSSGMMRDVDKWVHRDKRTNPNSGDIINFEAYNPFLAERIGRGITILETLLEREGDIFTWERVKMKRSWAERGAELYRLAWNMHLGQMLDGERPVKWLTSTSWLDVAGQYMSREAMTELLENLETDKYTDVTKFIEALQAINADYRVASYCWAHDELEKKLGHSPTEADIAEAVGRGKQSLATLQKMCAIDRNKDFASLMQVSYGLDWGAKEREEDFKAVRHM